MMDFRNQAFNARGGIDAEIKHPQLGWIRTTLTSGEIYDLALAAGPAPYVPPAVDLLSLRAEMTLTFAQLMIGLVAEGWITEAEANGWLDGALPAAVTTVIASLPEAMRFAARTRALRPSEVKRLDPLVAALAAAQNKTAAQIDAFFTTYSEV